MVEEFKGILRERHALSAGQPDDFSIESATDARKMLAGVQRVIFLYLPLVAATALVVGGIVSATLMLASVNQRISEIGMRRAVGARAEDIRLQFLLETGATILAGGVGGILFGYVLARMCASQMHLVPVTPWSAALHGVVSL